MVGQPAAYRFDLSAGLQFERGSENATVYNRCTAVTGIWSLTAMLWLWALGLEVALQQHSLHKQEPRCRLLTSNAAVCGPPAHQEG